MKFKRICVFCGSNFNGDPLLVEAVNKLAKVFTDNDIELVYGGGRVGVMGLIADAVLVNGGKVIGVIPQFLMDKEVGHQGLDQLIITENMHQRKQKMADLSDGFIILPGGFGTLEEFFEVLTWLQLGLHNNPIGVLNLAGFYDNLFTQLDVMVEKKYLKSVNRKLVFNESDADILVKKMSMFDASTNEDWFKDRNLT